MSSLQHQQSTLEASSTNAQNSQGQIEKNQLLAFLDQVREKYALLLTLF